VSLGQFCANIRYYSSKKVVKGGTVKLIEELVAELDALGFEVRSSAVFPKQDE
jgi:hypothetical protein